MSVERSPTAMQPPMSDRPIYLDHHATTPVDPRVLDRMLPWFVEKFGNPSSIGHRYGEEAREAVEWARTQVAALLHAEPREIFFTSGATESNNLALKGALLSRPPGGHLIVTAGEHRAVLEPAHRLQRLGYQVTRVPIDDLGQVSVEEIERSLREETVLVSVIWASHEVGTINPLGPIAELCQRRGVLLHSDAVQSVGKIPIDLGNTPLHLLSLSAHKFHGPKGIGALFVRRSGPRVPLLPQIEGGGQEQNLRGGTLPVPLIVGLGAACEIAGQEMREQADRLSRLRDRLWNGLRSELDGIRRHGHPTESLPHNLNVGFEGVEGDVLLARLPEWLAVSAGSACSSSDPEPSAVLRAMGVGEAEARATLRFGLGRGNTEAEIDSAAEHVIRIVKRLRQAESRS
jgi:cysteine desulfurase